MADILGVTEHVSAYVTYDPVGGEMTSDQYVIYYCLQGMLE